jgi:hypothetical protein
VTPTTEFPPGRYGRRRDPASRRRRRRLGAALGALVIVAGAAVALKLYRQYAEAPYQVRVVSLTGVTDTGVTVTFEVRKPPDAAAVCTVLARGRGGVEVGHARVHVPPGTTRVTYTLTTVKPPVTADVPGCGPAEQRSN